MLLDPNDPRCAPVPREQEDAGRAWWDSVCLPGDSICDVAERLGMKPSEVSAIKRGRRRHGA